MICCTELINGDDVYLGAHQPDPRGAARRTEHVHGRHHEPVGGAPSSAWNRAHCVPRLPDKVSALIGKLCQRGCTAPISLPIVIPQTAHGVSTRARTRRRRIRNFDLVLQA